MGYLKTLKPSREMLQAVVNACSTEGAKVRLKQLSGSLQGAIRLVIDSGTKDQVRDAFVGLDYGVTSTTGKRFTDPNIKDCWNADQINFYFISEMN